MEKKFDCVEMKRRLQAGLQEREKAFGEEEVQSRRRQWLATGEDALARWWRSLPVTASAKPQSLSLREGAVAYRTKEEE